MEPQTDLKITEAQGEWIVAQFGGGNAVYQDDNALQRWAKDQFNKFLDLSNEPRLREVIARVCASEKAADDKPLDERVKSLYKSVVAALPDAAVTEDASRRFTLESIAAQGLSALPKKLAEPIAIDNYADIREFLSVYGRFLERDSDELIHEIIRQTIMIMIDKHE